MAALLLAEVSDGQLAHDSTAKALSAAKALGEVTVLCAGARASDAAQAAAKFAGVRACSAPRMRVLATSSPSRRRG